MIATDWLIVVLRLVHITAGVLWVGSVFLFVVYLQPSAAALGPAGAPFMAELLASATSWIGSSRSRPRLWWRAC